MLVILYHAYHLLLALNHEVKEMKLKTNRWRSKSGGPEVKRARVRCGHCVKMKGCSMIV